MPNAIANVQFASQGLMPWHEEGLYIGSGGSFPFTTGCRYSDRVREGASSWGVYQISDSVATISSQDFDTAGFEPTLRDKIRWTSDGAEYTVMSFTKARLMLFFKFQTQRPTLSTNLTDTIKVFRLSNLPNSVGLRIPQKVLVYNDIPARLQPIQSQTQNIGTQQPRLNQFELYLSSEYEIEASDIIVKDAIEYNVTGESQIEQLGILARVTCERIEHGT